MFGGTLLREKNWGVGGSCMMLCGLLVERMKRWRVCLVVAAVAVLVVSAHVAFGLPVGKRGVQKDGQDGAIVSSVKRTGRTRNDGRLDEQQRNGNNTVAVGDGELQAHAQGQDVSGPNGKAPGAENLLNAPGDIPQGQVEEDEQREPKMPASNGEQPAADAFVQKNPNENAIPDRVQVADQNTAAAEQQAENIEDRAKIEQQGQADSPVLAEKLPGGGSSLRRMVRVTAV